MIVVSRICVRPLNSLLEDAAECVHLLKVLLLHSFGLSAQHEVVLLVACQALQQILLLQTNFFEKVGTFVFG